MKIGIDARFIGPQGTGLGKYTEKLITNLQSIDQANSYVIFLKSSNWDYIKITNKNFTKALADVAWYSLEEQVKLPGIFRKHNVDLVHIPHFNVPILFRAKFIVTIHDLIHHEFSQESTTTHRPLMFRGKRLAYKAVITSAVKRSQKIITPSSYVQGEIARNFKIDKSKIVVIYEAAEEEYFATDNRNTDSLLAKYDIKKPFLIYVGNAYPHKNLDVLLEAIKNLNNDEPRLNLVIVTARDVFTKRLIDKINNRGLEKQVTVTNYIPTEELSSIFRAASAYVTPSLSEGFGIPGLNAMAAGLPLLASDIPTTKEVYGKAAAYFDPAKPSQISRLIKKVLYQKKQRETIVEKGKKQVSLFSWEKMARETLKVYEDSART